MTKFVLTILACGLVMSLSVASWAIDPGVEGENYNCAFPRTAVLDGKFDEPAWLGVPWQGDTIQRETLTDSADADIEFAAVADTEWLYVAIKVTDDILQTGEDTGGNVWKDDSVEIYIDANKSAGESYDDDDVQITIGADNIGGDIDNPKLGGTGGGPDTGTKAAVVKTDNGWNVEAAVPLKNNKWDIKIKNGLVIGFNIHLNDDDDGGGRDHKLIWSKNDPDDRSWTSSAPFANLTFVEAPIVPEAVSPNEKVATVWGIIKIER